MPKIKMKVVDIESETNEKTGIVLYRVFVESNGKTYEFGAKEVDYLDEKRRKSIHKAWLKTIREDQMPAVSEQEKKRKKKEREDERSVLIGMDIEEDETKRR